MAEVDVTYQVYTNGRWLANVTNLSDYAGIYGSPIQGVYANLDKGNIQYRVHTQNGNWLSWVNDRSDYAGILGTNIDGLQMQISGLSGFNVKYRVYTGGTWLPWVIGLEDYAGIYGQEIEGIQVEIVSVDSNIDMNYFLKQSGNNGLFTGQNIEFAAFNLRTRLAVVSVSPKITIDGEVSLTSKLPGPTAYSIDISLGDAGVAKNLYELLTPKVSGLTSYFSQGQLAMSLKQITLSTGIDNMIKVAIFGDSKKAEVIFEATTNWSTTITAYHRIIVTIENNSNLNYVTVPIAATSGYDISLPSFAKETAFATFGGITIILNGIYTLIKSRMLRFY